MESLHRPTHCPVLGIELHYGNDRKYAPEVASLDRIDSTKGYTTDNVRYISLRANSLKSNATLDEITCVFLDMINTHA